MRRTGSEVCVVRGSPDPARSPTEGLPGVELSSNNSAWRPTPNPQSEIRNPKSIRMSDQLRQRLFAELDSIRLIDPHSHIEPKAAASKTLADILGYHYYTELIHSAGLPRAEIEEPDLDPKEKVRRLVERIEPLRNTIQYSWLLELARTFFDFPPDEDLTTSNWESLYDMAARKIAQPDWEQQVRDRTKLDAIFLTNNFDDPL